MGNLLNGKWTAEDTLSELGKGGRYEKQPAVFRDQVSADGATGYKAEPGRYHLYVAVVCPWAHRTVLFRALKKLEVAIPVHQMVQLGDGQGWSFRGDPHLVPGADRRARYLHEIYVIADAACTSRVSVPTLWDSKTRKVVNNESSEIMRMLNSEFDAFAGSPADFRPAVLRASIDRMNALVLRGINDAVNGCGRSISQQAYQHAFDVLFRTLDDLEAILGRQRYLCGDRQTESDWRLFPTLVRFDAIYYLAYKCNLRRIEDYPNLSNYLRELYQTPGISAVSDVEQMKQEIYGPGGPVPGNGIIPKGPWLGLDRPHDRHRLHGI